MVRDDLYITVPTFFRCPISLEVMKSPVSLSTGVTYDRSSIQRWLDSGHNTCPATMQLLPSTDFVPNHTLHRLIQIWLHSQPQSQSKSHSHSLSLSPDHAQSLFSLLNTIPSDDHQTHRFFESVLKLSLFAKDSLDNRRFLASKDENLQTLIGILARESTIPGNLYLYEEVIQLCRMVFDECPDKGRLARLFVDGSCLGSVEVLLQKVGSESKIACAKVLELIGADGDAKVLIAGRDGILSALVDMVRSESNAEEVEAGLSCLVCVSTPKQKRVKLVRLGAAKVLGKLLADTELRVPTVEKSLKLIEMLCSCREGRDSVSGAESCVPAIVQKVLKVSSVATERAVTILWSLCCLFRDHKAQEAVTRSNGLAKVLLLMQSNCSPAVKQMSRDLLKIFKVNSKCCLSSYETKTTHIMPF